MVHEIPASYVLRVDVRDLEMADRKATTLASSKSESIEELHPTLDQMQFRLYRG